MSRRPLATALLAATMLARPQAAAHAACGRDGDTVTVTGRLGIGHEAHPDDPAKRSDSYLIITFDPPVCMIEPGAPGGEPVGQASFLTARPPLKSALGQLQTFTGSLERGSDGTDEPFAFVTY